MGVFPSAMNPQLMHPVNYAHKILRFALDRLDRQDDKQNNIFWMTKLSIILCVLPGCLVELNKVFEELETMAYWLRK